MNQNISYVSQRMSLRRPLAEALEVVEQLADAIELKKTSSDEANKKEFLQKQLKAAQTVIKSCQDFEREFPSFAFSIATAIGKTRLMAAIIAYLYKEKGIKHFFVLAPNTTIYNKLIRDFADTTYEKYVFKGIAEFATNMPQIVTGDNYLQATQPDLFGKIQINIFNIDKFNKDSKATTKGGVKVEPRMKRLSEYIGSSYFDYLSRLDDLVILMDEAHRYRSAAASKALNELSPILGFELTATPITDKGKLFKNIIYEYNLAQALEDGLYVKNPSIARRRNFQKGSLTDDELDLLKLEDAVSIHEQTKVHLELYAKQNDKPTVKPFILVICKNIDHAKKTRERLESDDFFGGRYKGKVLQIDSSTKKEDEVEELLASLDNYDNLIEIVIHVNMLKEGWDVSNLYTIVPLRAADAPILVEQSIGRGLRLPYGGHRTEEPEVDKLTVIAHENFQAVIERAKDPNSVLHRVSYVEFDPEDVKAQKVVVKAKTQQEVKQAKQVAAATTEAEKKEAAASVSAQKAVWSAINSMNTVVKNYDELNTAQSIATVCDKAKEYIRAQAVQSAQSGNLFAEQEMEEQIAQVQKVVKMVVQDFVENIIPIPRMTIQQGETHVIYEDFDLDTSSGFNLPYLREEIVRVGLVDNKVEIIQALSSGAYGKPEFQIISTLIDYDDIDYDLCSDLLFKLATQAIVAVKKSLTPDAEITRVVHAFKRILADRIHDQIVAHMSFVSDGFVKPNILPFRNILPQHMTETAGYGRKDFREPVAKSDVPKYIFVGFAKTYYVENKFDSSTELDFAYVLETDPIVKKWLRPVTNQFNIYWGNGAHKYEPDFIIETEDKIYMVETKSAKELTSQDVQLKKAAAEEYCKHATAYNSENGGKPWEYALISHDIVTRTSSLQYLLANKV